MSHNTLLYIYGKRARNFWVAILNLFLFNFLYDDLRLYDMIVVDSALRASLAICHLSCSWNNS